MRLPVFGQKIQPIERTDETISRKGFLQMKDQEFYRSSRVYGTQLFGVSSAQIHKYVLDPLAALVMQQQAAEANQQLTYGSDVLKPGQGVLQGSVGDEQTMDSVDQ